MKKTKAKTVPLKLELDRTLFKGLTVSERMTFLTGEMHVLRNMVSLLNQFGDFAEENDDFGLEDLLDGLVGCLTAMAEENKGEFKKHEALES